MAEGRTWEERIGRLLGKNVEYYIYLVIGVSQFEPRKIDEIFPSEFVPIEASTLTFP